VLPRKKTSLKKPDKIETIIKERPYAAQMIQLQILYDMAGMLEDIAESIAQLRSEFRSTIPRGKIIPIELSLTDSITTLTREQYDTMPWMSFDLYNDGPDPVHVVVNEDFITEKAPLGSGESLKVDMKAPIIEKVMLYCGVGNTASVRIYAKR